MFDALIFTAGDAEPAARTLATLVEGVAEGMLGRATLVSPSLDPALKELAEAAGCGLAAGVAAEALAKTLAVHVTTPHALVLDAGALLPRGWPNALSDELRRAGGLTPDMALLFRPAQTADWLRLLFAVSVRGRMPFGHGGIAPRHRLVDPRYRGGPVKSHGPMHMSVMRTERTVEAART